MSTDEPEFSLRPWRRGDEDALIRHGGHREVWRNLTNRFPHPYVRADADSWIELSEFQGDPAAHLAIVVDGEPAGGIGATRQADMHERSAEIGYWLGPDYWGRGIATAALRRMTGYAFENFDFERLQASVLEWNLASCRVLEKAGYTLEGRLRRNVFKDGQLIDSFVYSRLRGE